MIKYVDVYYYLGITNERSWVETVIELSKGGI